MEVMATGICHTDACTKLLAEFQKIEGARSGPSPANRCSARECLPARRER